MRFTRYEQLSFFARRHFRAMLPALSVPRAANVALALTEMAAHRRRCRSRPFVFRLDPSSHCNVSCVACPTTRAPVALKSTMGWLDFRRIVEHIRRTALRVALYDMGEPLLNDNIYAMIGLLADHAISTSMSTNFMAFGPKQVDALLASRLTVLQPCLDGLTNESHGRYRRGAEAERVKANIAAVVRAKRARRGRLPVVDVQVIAFDHLRSELPLIAAYLAEAGVDRVTYRSDFLGIDGDHPGWIDQGPPHRGGCFWLYVGMAIAPNGDVRPCCGRGFDPPIYGNLATESLDDIWNNRYYRFSRKLFTRGPPIACPPDLARLPCVSCTRFAKRRALRPPLASNLA